MFAVLYMLLYKEPGGLYQGLYMQPVFYSRESMQMPCKPIGLWTESLFIFIAYSCE